MSTSGCCASRKPLGSQPPESVSDAIDFVTLAEGNYAKWVKNWLDSASRSNPQSRLFIYDASAQPSTELIALAARFPLAQIVPWPQSCWRWPDWVDTIDFQFCWPNFGLRDELKYWSRRLRERLTGRQSDWDWMTDKARFVARRQFIIRICSQKPYIIRDALARTDRPLAYIDADAVVLERFSAYPGGDSDFAVTVVDADQIRVGGEWEPPGPDGPLPVITINAGVMFANRTPGARRLLDTWIAEMSRVRHGAADQIALANLLYRHDREFFATMNPVLIGEASAIVACLTCARYNQVRIPETGIGSDVAVAHFVGSWKLNKRYHLVDDIVHKAWRERGLEVKAVKQ